jgi:hypothetical protein
MTWVVGKGWRGELQDAYPWSGYAEVEDGWRDLIVSLVRRLDVIRKRDGLSLEVLQIKEKFGGLRFYVSGANSEALDLINRAEEMSETICEYCGKPGKIKSVRGWYKCVCEDHADGSDGDSYNDLIAD